MRAFAAFLAYFFGCLLLSALLLPVLYPPIASLLGDEAEPSGALYRIAMLFMLAGFPWFLRRLDLFSWPALGFTLPARPAWAATARGFAGGVLMLAALVAGLLLTGARHPAPGPVALDGLLEAALAGVVGGLLVGVIEEAFFRGMLHTGMRRTLAFWPTALLTAVFYAAVHFMRPAELPAGAVLDPAASLNMLWLGLANLGDVAGIHDSFLALLVAGLLLSMVRERTGGILWCIGIHAGWVTVIRITKYLTDSGATVWIGDYDRITGWLAAIWLLLLAAAYWHWSHERIDPSRRARSE